MLTHKKLCDQVIVITGASSGMGLAMARMAARRGARVVLCSRNEGRLRAVCAEIREAGGQAIYFVADVSDFDAVRRLAEEAKQAFGRIDTWINNASQIVYGRLLDTSVSEIRRLMDVNFFGVVHGSKAAIPYLKQTQGALINIGSVAAVEGLQLIGAYGATKHAVKGFTDALRIELKREKIPITVTLILPSSINTPVVEHGRTHFREKPRLPPPLYSPQAAARYILACAEHPKRELFIGGAGRLLHRIGQIAPGLTDWLMVNMPSQAMKRRESQNHMDNLDAPMRFERQDGTHKGPVMRRSLYTWSVLRPLSATGYGLLVGIFGWTLLKHRSMRNFSLWRIACPRSRLRAKQGFRPFQRYPIQAGSGSDAWQ